MLVLLLCSFLIVPFVSIVVFTKIGDYFQSDQQIYSICVCVCVHAGVFVCMHVYIYLHLRILSSQNVYGNLVKSTGLLAFAMEESPQN